MDDFRGESPKLSVSVVVYNSSLALLRATLLSLQAAARKAMPEFLSSVAVTIVDNASDSDYRRQLGQMLSEIPDQSGFSLSRLDLTHNLGYGGGHNRALPTGDSTYHLVLNPDVELAQDTLQVGIAYLRDQPQIALLSPRAASPDGEQEFLCKRHPSVLVLLLRAFAPGLGQRCFRATMAEYQMSDVCIGSAPVDIPLASGCFMLLRSDHLSALGGFDEGYFMYFEDFDLSQRLSALGRLQYLPDMHIIHHGGYAGSKGLAHVKMFASAGVRFFRQHGWRWF